MKSSMLRGDLAAGAWSAMAGLITAATLVTSGCTTPGNSLEGEWRGNSIKTSAGTTRVTTVSGSVWGRPNAIELDSPTVLLGGLDLRATTPFIVDTHGRPFVGQKTTIVRVDSTGASTVLGRAGDGPGEYRDIAGLIVTSGDTLLVWDGTLRRVSWLDQQGRYIRSLTVTAPLEYPLPRAGVAGLDGRNLVLTWERGMVVPGGPPDTIIVARHPADTEGAASLVDKVQGTSWTAGTPFPGSRYPFGSRPLVAISRRGAVAVSDGVEYLIRIDGGTADSGKRIEIVRQWRRAPVGPDVSTPPAEYLQELPAPSRAPMEALFRAQEFGAERNSIDAMVFDDLGRLWCRVVDEAQHAHPMVMGRMPSMRPSRYQWEIFGVDGRLLGAVSVPSRFNVTQITAGWVYGRLETEEGDAVVARMKLPVRFPE